MPGVPDESPRTKAGERVERARMTTRRLVGLDRSGPPPVQTLAGQPLNPWTLPNAIGYVRLALIPVFLVIALESDDGVSPAAFIVFAVIAWSDYLDGLTARATGQYSRLGALLDPLTDRLLVVAAVVVAWNFELLPRWALAVLAARELLMLVTAQLALRRGLVLQINWFGRIGVWPTMGALGLALLGLETIPEVMLYVGLALTLIATVLYGVTMVRALRAPAEQPAQDDAPPSSRG